MRETSSATTKLILGYVRGQAGDGAVRQVLDRARLSGDVAKLESDSHWVSYEDRIRLMEAATVILGDSDAMRKVGASALRLSISPSLVLLLRALGSPSQVFRHLPRAVAKFSTTSVMRVPETTRTSALIRYRLHNGYQHSRLDCAYAQGLLSVVPEIFGLPPARIVHDECESYGAPECVYHVTWAQRRRWKGRIPRNGGSDAEKDALRGQLEALQSAASDLVSTDDLDTVLDRIVRGAASAVLAQGYLLAVHTPDGGTLVRADGVPAARRDELAARLLADEDLDETAVVVDVASSRMRHGRLAAIYSPGQRGLADEGRLLGAYARHAAAALDMIGALEESRRGQRRVHAMLELSRRLAATTSSDHVVKHVTEALPQVTGGAARILLWDADKGELRGKGDSGLSTSQHGALVDIALRPQEVPELADMMQTRQPLRVSALSSASAALKQVMADLQLTQMMAVPIVSGDQFFGVIMVAWTGDQSPANDESDLTMRLLGVADQAATALTNAHLVATVRHQALHDPLTSVPNRVLFTDRLERALSVRSGDGVAVLFCDLDRFKQVNDGLGHAAGDELLRRVAQRLMTAIREGDSLGRLSGDEFAVLLPNVAGVDAAVDVGRRITSNFQRPFLIDGHELRVTVSVGVAHHSGPGGRVDQLLRAADAAMYDAKRRGRNRVSTGSA